MRYVASPGQGQPIRRPSALHQDIWHHELLVADGVGNRIHIFQPTGSFLFSFPLGETMTSPRDVATDPAGTIFVLGAVVGGAVVERFDFDGQQLGPVHWPGVAAAAAGDVRSLACDASGRLYGLDHGQLRVISYGLQDGQETSFSLADQLGGGAEARQQVLGRLTWAGGELLVPVSSLGTVLRYSTAGEFLGSIGHQGSVPGTLNFPVAVEVSPAGHYLVLDKNRFNVACFSREGRFLGEFGGKGVSPGWFIQPSLLAIPTAEHVVVGQIYQNKIQLCTLPPFALAQRGSGGSSSGVPWRGTTSDEPEAESGSLTPRRYSDSRSFASSQSGALAPHATFVGSESEVSE